MGNITQLSLHLVLLLLTIGVVYRSNADEEAYRAVLEAAKNDVKGDFSYGNFDIDYDYQDDSHPAIRKYSPEFNNADDDYDLYRQGAGHKLVNKNSRSTRVAKANRKSRRGSKYRKGKRRGDRRRRKDKKIRKSIRSRRSYGRSRKGKRRPRKGKRRSRKGKRRPHKGKRRSRKGKRRSRKGKRRSRKNMKSVKGIRRPQKQPLMQTSGQRVDLRDIDEDLDYVGDDLGYGVYTDFDKHKKVRLNGKDLDHYVAQKSKPIAMKMSKPAIVYGKGHARAPGPIVQPDAGYYLEDFDDDDIDYVEYIDDLDDGLGFGDYAYDVLNGDYVVEEVYDDGYKDDTPIEEVTEEEIDENGKAHLVSHHIVDAQGHHKQLFKAPKDSYGNYIY